LAVESVTLGTQEALTAPLLVAEGGNPPLEIRLTAETGSITGVCERGARLVILQRKGTTTTEIASVQVTAYIVSPIWPREPIGSI
jgi:hypothetical protein